MNNFFLKKMPEVGAFLQGFGLTKGHKYGQYEIISVTATHKQIIRYKEYRYDIKIILQCNKKISEAEYKTFFHQLMDNTDGPKIINSAYGNPYKCVIDNIEEGHIIDNDNDQLIVHLTGHSYRV
jgi:hypothetical protein